MSPSKSFFCVQNVVIGVFVSNLLCILVHILTLELSDTLTSCLKRQLLCFPTVDTRHLALNIRCISLVSLIKKPLLAYDRQEGYSSLLSAAALRP